MQPELVDEFSIDPKQGRFISDTLLLLLLLGGGTAAGAGRSPLPVISDLKGTCSEKKREKERKEKALANTPSHTPEYIHKGW